MLVIALLLALGTAIATGVASVLQAVSARRHEPATTTQLVLSPLYLTGTALDVVGFLLMVAALHWLPLFLVQCAAASSIGVTAIVGRRVLGTVLRRRDLFALAGIGAGLALLASGARPEHASTVSRTTEWCLLVAAAPLLVVGTGIVGLARERAGVVLATIAGLAFAGTGIASRMLSNAHGLVDLIKSPASYALLAFSVGGMAFFAASLQRTNVTVATAALFAVQTVTASCVGLLALGDSTRNGFAALTALGFVGTLGCAITLCFAQPGGSRVAQPAVR